MKPTPEAEQVPGNWWVFPVTRDGLLLLLLSACLLALFPYAAISGDQARDLRIASEIVAGTSTPLTGPLLASHFHLGPIWYYFLAGLHWLGLDGFSIHGVIAGLAVLQIPLVYLCGRRWLGTGRAGMVWASFLLVPSWALYEQIFPGHTSLTGVLTAAMLLASVSLMHRPRLVTLYLLPLIAGLALHAHPTVILLFPIPAICFSLAWRASSISTSHFLAAMIAPLLLLAPALVSDAWSPSWALSTYLSSDQGRGSLNQLGPILWQLSGGPMDYWLERVAGLPSTVSLLIGTLWAATLGLGLSGALKMAWSGDRVAAIFLATMLVAVLGLVLGRAIFPYYMFGGVRIVLLGLAAAGLVFWVRSVWFQRLATVVCVALYGIVVLPAAHNLRQGSWPFSFVPLFAVNRDWQPPVPLALTTSSAMREGGQWLCAQGPVVVHGSWAQMLVISLGMEARLSCRQHELALGAATLPGAARHWLGLSAFVMDSLEIEPAYSAGPWRLVPAKPVFGETVSVRVPADIPDPPSPPLPLPQADPWSVELVVSPADGGYLAVSNLAFGIAPAPELSLVCDDKEAIPVANDAVSTVFSIACDSELRLTLVSSAPQYVDIVTF